MLTSALFDRYETHMASSFHFNLLRPFCTLFPLHTDCTGATAESDTGFPETSAARAPQLQSEEDGCGCTDSVPDGDAPPPARLPCRSAGTAGTTRRQMLPAVIRLSTNHGRQEHPVHSVSLREILLNSGSRLPTSLLLWVHQKCLMSTDGFEL